MDIERLKKVRKWARTAVDKLGNPIDDGILETVIALTSLDVNTVSSCEGHFDRVTGGPYVMFEAPGVQKIVDDFRAIRNRLDPAYKRLYDKATIANAHQAQKVIKLLHEFYTFCANTTDTIIPAEQRLVVHFLGPTACRLACQGADLAHIRGYKERAELLYRNRAEMQAFTKYLISKFEPSAPLETAARRND
jgi:hypothetical protein